MAQERIFSENLSVVYQPEDQDPIVDIIIVHGLQGHPYKTFAYAKASKSLDTSASSQTDEVAVKEPKGRWHSRLRGAIGAHRKPPSAPDPMAPVAKSTEPNFKQSTDHHKAPNFVFWPTDLLPLECPRARILTFGYDTKITKYTAAGVNKSNVFAHGKDFLFSLSRERKLGRPLIIVAHSLGGIVTKEMLASSSNSNNPAEIDIVESVAAVIFMGTPHRGSPDLAAFGNWARGLVSAFGMATTPDILQTLGLKNDDLERAQESFSRLWHKHDFKVKTFQEGLGVTGINLGVLGNKVVPDYSSLIGDARERAETMQANHMDMCRFYGPQDSNYRKLSGEITSTYLDLSKLHGLGHGAQPSRDKRLSIPQSPSVVSFGSKTSALAGNAKDCLRSLWFQSINIRSYGIEKPADGTATWLFEHQSFQAWLSYEKPEQHFGLLWLKGKPGSGKSTLMKEAYHQLSRKQTKSGFCTAAFFFSAKGDKLQHSTLGLLRSLLYQLLPKHKDHLKTFTKFCDERGMFTGSGDLEWTEAELKSFFQTELAKKSNRRTIIFVDALDECDAQEIRAQAYFWRELTKTAHSHGALLSVCLSSRQFPSVTVGNCPEISVEDHNRADITTYVNRKFELGCSFTPQEESHWDPLKQKILQNSEGVFLWTALVVDATLEKIDEGKSLPFLLKDIDTVPCELKTLFLSLFESLDQQNKDLVVRLFQWALLTTKPLRVHEWHHVLALIKSEARKPTSIKSWRESGEFTDTDEQLEKQIRLLSRGLIEVKQIREDLPDDRFEELSNYAEAGSLDLEVGNTRVVQVIHESVRELFLHDGGFAALDPSLQPNPVSAGHISIMVNCLDYLKIAELDALVQARTPAPPELSMSFFKDNNRGPKPRRRGSVASFSSAGSHSGIRFNNPATPKKSPVMLPQAAVSPGSMHLQDTSLGRQSPKLTKDESFDLMQHVQPKVTAWIITSAEADTPEPGTRRKSIDSIKSVAGVQSRVLEDHPALLFYVLFEIFNHAKLVDQGGHNAIDRLAVLQRLLDDNVWDRWLALREDVPYETDFIYYAAELGLGEWVAAIRSHLDTRNEWLDSDPAHYVAEAARQRDANAFEILLDKFGYDSSYLSHEDGPLLQQLVRLSELALILAFLSRARQWSQDIGAGIGSLVDLPASKGPACLHKLAKSRNCLMANHLLDFGFDVNVEDVRGRTPLHYAAMVQDTDLDWTIEQECESITTSTDMIELLLNNGADIHATDRAGCTPLHIACYGRPDLIGEHPRDVIVAFCVYKSPPNKEAVHALLDKGADVNAKEKQGRTPLHLASFGGILSPERNSTRREVIDLLLARGADVNARSELGESPLHMASRCRDVSVVSTLLDQGALIDAKLTGRDYDSGLAPMHLAAWLSNAAVVGELLERGGDVHAVDERGRTPLHLASWYLQEKAVLEKLLSVGAKAFTLLDKADKSAYDYASRWKEPYHAKLFEEQAQDRHEFKPERKMNAESKAGSHSEDTKPVDKGTKAEAESGTL